MKQLLLRCDDMGFSRGVNYGVYDSLRAGLVKNCGVMVNLDATAHAVELLKGLDCCLGLHCSVSVGPPIAPPETVPSLVDENGQFHSSRRYREAKRAGREEFASVQDLKTELTAQYGRFIDLFGRKPAWFEAHAVESDNLAVALEQVAEENGLFYQPSFQDFTLGGTRVQNIPSRNMEPDYDPFAALTGALTSAEEGSCHLFVCHPGYVDSYLLAHSSLTCPRPREAAMLQGRALGEWLAERGYTLVTYDQLAQKTL